MALPMSDSRPASIRALLFASTAAGMLCASSALAAPESPEPAPEAASIPDTSIVSDDAQDGPWLGTIDVDGRRTARQPVSPEFVAPLVDTPRAVTIIPQQIIEQTAATSLQDILRTSPGITFGAGEGGQPLADRPFIRGQSSGNNIFVDGIRDTRRPAARGLQPGTGRGHQGPGCRLFRPRLGRRQHQSGRPRRRA